MVAALQEPSIVELQTAASAVLTAQQAIRSIGEARDALTKEIAEQYKIIESASYPLRLHLSAIGKTAARVGDFEIAAKHDIKKRRLSRVLFGNTGEVRIMPTEPTSRIVVRMAKP